MKENDILNNPDIKQSADKMAKELVKISESMEFDEEALLDIVNETISPVEQFFANYSCAIMEIETKFKVLNEQFSLKYDGNPIESIKSRVKDYDSIIRKIIKKNLPRTLEAIEENINDIAGVRVICSFEEDIYRLAKCLLQQDDITLISKKDYIRNPKPSGYRSLHLIVSVPIFLENEKKDVKVEVQFRTIAMDFWASLEHKLKYKKDIAPEKLEILTRELVDCANVSASLDRRMQNVRNIILGESSEDFY
jgi:putative GTP pyrophosphokinase